MWTLTILAALAGDDPRISTSRGTEGGVVVLHPRVIPATEDPRILQIAAAVQAHAHGLVQQAHPETPVDLRPAPERTCPRAGCLGVSFGSVLVHAGDNCAVAAWVAAPGPSPAQPIAWSPGLAPKVATVPFREPIESALSVSDYQPCASIVAGLGAGDDAVKAALTHTLSLR